MLEKRGIKWKGRKKGQVLNAVWGTEQQPLSDRPDVPTKEPIQE